MKIKMTRSVYGSGPGGILKAEDVYELQEGDALSLIGAQAAVETTDDLTPLPEPEPAEPIEEAPKTEEKPTE